MQPYGGLCFGRRTEGVQGGNGGKQVSSGYNRRRRLATQSSGKQQAGRTAVRAAPIVYPEESPQRARWRIPLSCVDTPTPRRGCRGASGKPPCLHHGQQLCRRNSLLMGNDAPTPAREKGLQPYGALTLFFRWRKKSVQKKASGTATPGKSPLLPIFERGSSQCRAQHTWTANMDVRARSCSL